VKKLPFKMKRGKNQMKRSHLQAGSIFKSWLKNTPTLFLLISIKKNHCSPDHDFLSSLSNSSLQKDKHIQL